MKQKLLNNIGIKILSAIVAVVLWVLVVNVDDYMVTKTISGIAVTVKNEDTITELNKVYELDGDGTVAIVVKGPRSKVEGLTAQDFNATVDLSQLSLTNAVQVTVTPKKSALKGHLTISCTTSQVSVKLENRKEVQLPITVVTEGSPAEGYAVIGKSTTPNMVTISGAESVVNRVKTVQVKVDVNNAAKDVSVVASLVYLNSDGEKVSQKRIQSNVEDVDATVEIVRTKEIPVNITTDGEVAMGYAVKEVLYQPTKILVAGREDALKKIDALEIKGVRIAGFTKTEEIAVNISEYLPSGVLIADDSEQIMIQIVVEPVVSKDMMVSAGNISMKGLADGLKCAIIKIDNPAVTAKGLQDLLDKLILTDLDLHVDLTGYEPGEYAIPVQFNEIDGADINCSVIVHVVISEESTETAQ